MGCARTCRTTGAAVIIVAWLTCAWSPLLAAGDSDPTLNQDMAEAMCRGGESLRSCFEMNHEECLQAGARLAAECRETMPPRPVRKPGLAFDDPVGEWGQHLGRCMEERFQSEFQARRQETCLTQAEGTEAEDLEAEPAPKDMSAKAPSTTVRFRVPTGTTQSLEDETLPIENLASDKFADRAPAANAPESLQLSPFLWTLAGIVATLLSLSLGLLTLIRRHDGE